LITNEADNIVLKTIIKYNVKLSDVFGEGYEQEFMLNKLILKCWSIQTSIRKRVFDAFVSAELY